MIKMEDCTVEIVEQSTEKVVFSLNGLFEYQTSLELQKQWNLAPEAKHYEVDMTNVYMIESSALGMLMLLRMQAGGDKADITLKVADDNVMWALNVARFHELFTVIECEQQV